MSASTLFDDYGGSVYTVPRSAYTARSYDSSLILHNVSSTSVISDQDLKTLNLQVKRLERKRQLRRELHGLPAAGGNKFKSNGGQLVSGLESTLDEEDQQDVEEEETDLCAYNLEQWLKKIKCTGVTGRTLEHFQEIKVGVLEDPVDPDNCHSLEPYPDLYEEEFEYKGGKVRGEYHGKAVLEFSNGDVITGTFRDGLRHGDCRISTGRNGINALYGHYVDDELHGKAKVMFEDGDWLEGYFKEGVLHGFGRYFDRQGRLKCVANHKNGVKHGVCWQIVRGGGCIVGRVDTKGRMSGIRVAYLYPDFRTALVGHFEDGLMKAAQVATLKTTIDDFGIKVPIFTEPKGDIYRRELATFDMVTSEPKLPDPYESRMVRVATSKVDGANEGLFAARAIEPNTVIAFYNGKRIRPCSKEDVDHADWEVNAYKIFDPSRKNGTIDIPFEFRDLDKYCATLAHKTNHSFLPNAEFVSYDHPKYGLVPCLVSNHDIRAGEEIFVHYGYHLDGCPEWYEEAWRSGNYPVPDSLKEEDRDWEDTDYQRNPDEPETDAETTGGSKDTT